jgi:hypothetical protein
MTWALREGTAVHSQPHRGLELSLGTEKKTDIPSPLLRRLFYNSFSMAIS